MNTLKLVVWSDTQYPYVDFETDSAFNSFLRSFQPDIAILNGDGLDFPGIASAFDRNPITPTTISSEILGFRAYIREKSEILGERCRKHFNEGNHEDRLRKYIWRRAPALEGLEELDLRHMLGFDEHGWTYTPYYDSMNPDNNSPDTSPGINVLGLLVVHGWQCSKWSAQTARICWEKFHGSGICGHTHRLGEFYHTHLDESTRERVSTVWFEGGCMCRLNPPWVAAPDWQQGFIAGYVFPDRDGGPARFSLHTVPIIHHKFVWNGELFVPQ